MWPGCTPCGPSRTASPLPPPVAGTGHQIGGGRCRIHRFGGGRHLPRPRRRGDRGRGAPGAVGRASSASVWGCEACAGLHAAHGVEIRTGVAVSGLLTEEAPGGPPGAWPWPWSTARRSRPTSWSWGSGSSPPPTGWANRASPSTNGVRAYATLHAADDVVVAGDTARWFDERVGAEILVEHWTNAAEPGVAAARNLLAGRDGADPYSPVPYFWSDQYDTKIQMIGHPASRRRGGRGGRAHPTRARWSRCTAATG